MSSRYSYQMWTLLLNFASTRDSRPKSSFSSLATDFQSGWSLCLVALWMLQGVHLCLGRAVRALSIMTWVVTTCLGLPWPSLLILSFQWLGHFSKFPFSTLERTALQSCWPISCSSYYLPQCARISSARAVSFWADWGSEACSWTRAWSSASRPNVPAIRTASRIDWLILHFASC